MITGIEITRREPFVGGATFGDAGAYERIEAVALGALDPTDPRNLGIALLDQAPRDTDGLVRYRSAFVLLRPINGGNGRLLYEVNNRGRIMLFANLCAGLMGNRPETAADLGNALPLRLGFALLWSGWDINAPAATGLSLTIPVADGVTQPVREEFVSGTRLGTHEVFKPAHEAAGTVSMTVRRTQTSDRRPVGCTRVDARTVRLDDAIEPGSIYEVRYTATRPPVQGIGFAATRDLVSYLRFGGGSLLQVTHTLAFGISQAGRYLRDHLAQGFNADEAGRRVFDGVFTHVAGIGRLFLNTPFAQPFRTRTWHEDHDFPEVAFPFRTADLTGGDRVKVIETNTSTEYWQKGASLLHTDAEGLSDTPPSPDVRTFLIAGTQHGGKAGMPRDNGPCRYPRNWHDPMPTVRALLVALDDWVVAGRPPPDSLVPRIEDGTLVAANAVTFPAGIDGPSDANDVADLPDWVAPSVGRRYAALVPQVDADGNERSGVLLPEVAEPLGTFTGWNLYAEPYPPGELADRDGAFIAFPATDAERATDARASVAARYPGDTRGRAVGLAASRLVEKRLLLAEDAVAWASTT